MLSVDSNQPIIHDIFINNLKTALSSCRHLLLAEYVEPLFFSLCKHVPCESGCHYGSGVVLYAIYSSSISQPVRSALAKVVKEQRHIRYTLMPMWLLCVVFFLFVSLFVFPCIVWVLYLCGKVTIYLRNDKGNGTNFLREGGNGNVKCTITVYDNYDNCDNYDNMTIVTI